MAVFLSLQITLSFQCQRCYSILSALQVSDGRSFQVKARFDTEVELTYYRHGGILNYMVRQML